MKKTLTALALAALLLALPVAGLAAGGSASDPLISVSYLTKTLLPALLGKTETKLETAGTEAESAVSAELEALRADTAETIAKKTARYDTAQAGTELRLKAGDRLLLRTGASAALLAGAATAAHEGGAVVDTTDGSESASVAMRARHSYLAGEDGDTALTIDSDTAVLVLEGQYLLRASAAVDYNELAAALRELGLFRGKDTAIGSGYALEDPATRIEGLVMFLRLIGEEQAALAYQAETHRFTDVPAWAAPYADYAWAMGYTKGVNEAGTLFDTYREIGALEYMTFVLRALGYSEAEGDFAWNTSVERAAALGCLNGAEAAYFAEAGFLRAQVVYLSYHALGAYQRGAAFTLLDRLSGAGVLDAAGAQAVISAVQTARMA